MSIPAGDFERGKKLFKQRCITCHSIEKGARHKSGPNLFGLFGRKMGETPGYDFSDANKRKGEIWTKQVFFEYIENPREYMPGTTMVFAGLKKVQDRADLIDFVEKSSK